MNLTKELEISQTAAQRAAEAILDIYHGRAFQVEMKDNKSPLTSADKKANDIIVKTLSETFPDYALLSEESQDDRRRLANKWCWIVDPLDGTKEFIKRNGEFTVNIALSYENRAVLGVIYVPVTHEMYYAVKGQGAYHVKNHHACRIYVSERKKDIRLVMSRSHASEQLQRVIDKNAITDIKKSGSSLKGCLVAQGAAEIYYRFNPTMEWDTAAMQCIAEEAGGIFRQLDDSEMLYNRENSLNSRGFYVLNCADNKLEL